jgi:hypothetical protein
MDGSPSRTSRHESAEPIGRVALAQEDAQAITSLMAKVVEEFPDLEFASESGLARLAVLCHELPETVRSALVHLRLLNEPSGGLVLSGLPIDFTAIGPTPDSHEDFEHTYEVRKAAGLQFLIASLLGDAMSQAGVRDGRLIQDICPLKGDETTQLASSSVGGLDYHCEDAYHDYRPDWILLMCLRNPDGVATTFARVADLPLDDWHEFRDILFEKRFPISPDSSHSNSDNTRLVAILSGDPASPYVRVDPAFMPRVIDNDPTAEKALGMVIDALDRGLTDVVLQPGDVMIIDNLRTVHGRKPFKPRYDGNDRWLRALSVTSDLRRSAGKRTGANGRAMLPQTVFD